MQSPRLPLVLLEGGSFQGIYGSVDDLVAPVEGYDVRAGAITVLDADGREIVLSTDKKWGTPIVVRPSDLVRATSLSTPFGRSSRITRRSGA